MPYLQANMVGLIGLQRKDVFRRNVRPFFLATFVFFFIFSVKGIEPVNRFLLVFMQFSWEKFRTLIFSSRYVVSKASPIV